MASELYHQGLISERIAKRIEVPYKAKQLEKAKLMISGNVTYADIQKAIEDSSKVTTLTKHEIKELGTEAGRLF